MENNIWDAMGALGQWAGAIATFLAVWVALQQNRSKVKLLLKEVPPLYPGMSKLSLKIIAINKKIMPITIKEASFMTWSGRRVIIYNFFGTQLPVTLNTSESIEFEVSDNQLISGLNNEGYNGRVILKFFIMDSTYRFQYKYLLLDIDKKTIYFSWWQLWKLLKFKALEDRIDKMETKKVELDSNASKNTKDCWLHIATAGSYIVLINTASLIAIYYVLMTVEKMMNNGLTSYFQTKVLGVTSIILIPCIITYLLFCYCKEYILKQEEHFKLIFNLIVFLAALLLLLNNYSDEKIGDLFWSGKYFWGIPLTMLWFRVILDYQLLKRRV